MSPHRRVSAQRPPSAQWSGVAGVSRAACPPKAQRHSSPELNSGILGSQRPVFFCPCSCRRQNWPPFFSFLHFHSEMAESLSPLAPEPAVPCREMPSSLRPLPLCASLPANARNPADQISLFPICRWFGPIGRVSAVPRLVAGAHICDALDQAGLDCDDPYHDSRGQDGSRLSISSTGTGPHRRTRPSLAVSVARRGHGPAVFWCWRCVGAWLGCR